MSFEDERDLLKRWTALVLETDPDVIIGLCLRVLSVSFYCVLLVVCSARRQQQRCWRPTPTSSLVKAYVFQFLVCCVLCGVRRGSSRSAGDGSECHLCVPACLLVWVCLLFA